MVATVVAVTDPDFARVGVTLDAFAAESTTVYRVRADGSQTPVRPGQDVGLISGDWFGYDYEAPLNEAVHYEAADGVSVISSSTVTLDVGQTIWLKNPFLPVLNFKPRLARLPGITSPARQSVRTILGRSSPIVKSDVRGTAIGEMSVLTYNVTEEEALLGFIAGTSVAFLQIPNSYFGGRYVVFGDATAEPFTRVATERRIQWSMPWQEIAWLAGGVSGDLTATWDLVEAEYATWDDMRDTEGTWTGLLQGIDSLLAG